MKRFRVVFEIEVEHGDYLGAKGEMYIRNVIEECFCGENVEIEVIEENE